jgi:hypothetical protein
MNFFMLTNERNENYHLSQNFKLIENYKFNYVINILTFFFLLVNSNSLLISDTEHIKYSIKMKSKLREQSSLLIQKPRDKRKE